MEKKTMDDSFGSLLLDTLQHLVCTNNEHSINPSQIAMFLPKKKKILPQQKMLSTEVKPVNKAVSKQWTVKAYQNNKAFMF